MKAEYFKKLTYGPEPGKAILIVENQDGEGGGFDVYSSDNTPDVIEAAVACVENEKKERVARVASWKKWGWRGAAYSRHYSFTALVITKDGKREDFSLPEEDTGL